MYGSPFLSAGIAPPHLAMLYPVAVINSNPPGTAAMRMQRKGTDSAPKKYNSRSADAGYPYYMEDWGFGPDDYHFFDGPLERYGVTAITHPDDYKYRAGMKNMRVRSAGARRWTKRDYVWAAVAAGLGVALVVNSRAAPGL
jgi:hypothetical protein